MIFQFCRGENYMQHVETAAMALSSAATRGKCLCVSEKAPWKLETEGARQGVCNDVAKSYRAAREPSDLQLDVGSRRGGLGVGDGDPHRQRECWARIQYHHL